MERACSLGCRRAKLAVSAPCQPVEGVAAAGASADAGSVAGAVVAGAEVAGAEVEPAGRVGVSATARPEVPPGRQAGNPTRAATETTATASRFRGAVMPRSPALVRSALIAVRVALPAIGPPLPGAHAR
jgi:hypothetical protein